MLLSSFSADDDHPLVLSLVHASVLFDIVEKVLFRFFQVEQFDCRKIRCGQSFEVEYNWKMRPIDTVKTDLKPGSNYGQGSHILSDQSLVSENRKRMSYGFDSPCCFFVLIDQLIEILW